MLRIQAELLLLFMSGEQLGSDWSTVPLETTLSYVPYGLQYQLLYSLILANKEINRKKLSEKSYIYVYVD